MESIPETLEPGTNMEVTKDQISYSDKVLTTDKDNSRLWFIANQEPESDSEFFDVKLLSRYWQNYNQLGCEYSSQIMKRIGLES